ncbi:GTPase HflX [Treponema phagedenis]|uniref:GTPase HflX n=1 Tax=Treponema phagedenis TaxID=162 RepID=UPI0001F6373A|nr:GTPase HflX [Treponema phagedenis]EFW36994.1 GTP-binding protein HflX [Treponema phagedenis F0421]TYT78796.1 GTPase HflX [Treponema phagedenis]
MNLQELKQEQKKALLIFTDVYSEKIIGNYNVKSFAALKAIEEEELKNLTETIFVNPVFSLRFNINTRNPATFVGSGQLEKIAETASEENADVIIFNSDLSPRVQRNLEAALDLCVIDRREVIIQIFADRAQTREAVVQAQLARLEYSMPRLTRRWTGLAQQRGGVKGSRGAGEKKLELDRRRVRTEITRLKNEVEKVRVQRTVQRKNRIFGSKKIGAIVGYTNSGKSSLLKKLSGTEIFTEDKLFATLDAETRKIYFENELGSAQFLLTDTVGFVSNLPHQLIDAFRSTLEEAAIADFLLIICDASHPAMRECLNVTMEVLHELNCADKPTVIAINKMDAPFDPTEIMALKTQHPEAVEISVKTGLGIENLKTALFKQVQNRTKTH